MAEQKQPTTQVRIPTILKELWEAERVEFNKTHWKELPLTDFLAVKFLKGKK